MKKKVLFAIFLFFCFYNIFGEEDLAGDDYLKTDDSAAYMDDSSDLSSDFLEYKNDMSFFTESPKTNNIGLKGWITDFPSGTSDIKGYRLSGLKEEPSGIIFYLQNKDVKLRVSVIKKIRYDEFVEKLNILKSKIGIGEEFIDKRGYGSVTINQADINFGDRNAIFVMLRFTKLYLNVNRLRFSTLNLTKVVEGESLFTYYADDKSFTYNINIPKIRNTTGIGDSFEGWSYYLEKLYLAIEEGYKQNNDDIFRLIYNTQMNVDKVWIKPERQKSDMSIGSMVQTSYSDYRLNLKFLLNGTVKNIGHPDWIYRPFGIIFAGGLWGEGDIGYLLRNISDFSNFEIFSMVNFGITMQFGFNVGIPAFRNEIIDGKKTLAYDNDIVKLGYEMFFDVNLNLESSYLLNIQPLFVLYLIPSMPARLDFFIGGAILFSYKDDNFKESGTDFCVGMRIAFDYTFNKATLRKDIKQKKD